MCIVCTPSISLNQILYKSIKYLLFKHLQYDACFIAQYNNYIALTNNN